MSVQQQLAELVEKAEGLLGDLANRQPKEVVNEETTINAGATKEYDLQTLLGANYAKYDMTEVHRKVTVKDPVAGSPTVNMFIGAEGVATVALRLDRYLRITNNYETNLVFRVTLSVPQKPITA